MEDVELSHDGPLCSFDAFLKKYSLSSDAALEELAVIVRGADTARLDLAPQCAGLLAISLGLSRLFADDHEQMRHGFVVYDALYAWLREARTETHAWNPQRNAAVDTHWLLSLFPSSVARSASTRRGSEASSWIAWRGR